MKRIFSILVAVLLTATVWAQSPEAISYQAVVRDASSTLVANQTVGMQISILQSSANGVAVYTETHDAETNINGLVSIEIGNGTTSDDFSSIDWSADTYFIKTETDPEGGSNYTITGVSQFLSVPYALHAKTAESVNNLTVDYGDVQNTPDLSNYDTNGSDDFDGDYESLTNLPVLPTVPENVSEFSNDAGYITEDTTLTETEVDAMVSNNGYLTSFTEVDGSVTNELQSLAEVVAINDSVNSQLKNVSDPTDDNDAVNKAYVDALISRIEVLELAQMQPTDIDGNTYEIVKIGDQIWMAENLKTTSYPNGDAIPNVTSNSAWEDLGDNDTDDAYCIYNNNANNEADTYGALYTYAAALNACPAGWHLPTDAEWKTLEMELGMSQSDADDTSSRGTNEGSQLAGNSDLWNSGDLENNSEFGTSGFSALSGGRRNLNNGSFSNEGNYGAWWSSTEYDRSTAYSRWLYYGYSTVNRSDSSKSGGLSVRCLRD